MSTDTITEKPEERQRLAGYQPQRESAPSVVRDDEMYVPRGIGMAGAVATIFGGMALAFHMNNRAVNVSFGAALFMVLVGLAGLAYHAAFDRDIQFRRLYMAFGFLALALGDFLFVYPYLREGSSTFRYGFVCQVLSTLFVLAFLRNETEDKFRETGQYALAINGGLLALIGLGGGLLRGDFLLPAGLILALVGLCQLIAFIGSRGVSDDRAYAVALGLGVVGLLVLLIVLVRSFLPAPTGVVSYFKTFGFLLSLMCLLYLGVSFLFCSDTTVAVLTRRELGSFFFSPLAYLTLLGFTVSSCFSYWFFLDSLLEPNRPVFEPVVRSYLFALFPVIVLICSVPVLTMRLFSEEYRSGTLEVLLTAPVSEVAVVLSKFLAAFITFMVVWSPFWLFLMTIPLAGGAPFDYTPLLSFFIVLTFTMMAFVSMGMFFSALTSSQIASGVLTFAGMLALTSAWMLAGQVPEGSPWETILRHMSYLDLWLHSLQGKLVPRSMLFYPSLAVLSLFLTVKVLEARKWG